MRCTFWIIATCAIWLAAGGPAAYGQLFGGRALGGSVPTSRTSGSPYIQPLTPMTPQQAFQQPMQGGLTAGAGRVGGGLGRSGNIGGTAGRNSLFPGMGGIGGMGGAQGGAAGSGQPSLLGSGRFLREMRAPGSFVGTDSREADHFVGAQEGDDAAAVQSAITDLRRLTTTLAGRGTAAGAGLPTTQTRTKLYAPQLTVGFDYSPPAASHLGSTLKQRLESCSRLARQTPIEVSLEGSTAILRGTVASERDRSLAQMLALFEPGIASVRNELSLSAPAPSPPTPNPPPPVPGDRPRF